MLLFNKFKLFIYKKFNRINKLEKLIYLNFKKNNIPLFWYDHPDFKNFGDQLNPYIISKITDMEIVQIKHIPLISNKKILFAIGSILTFVNKNCLVWGSGIIDCSIKIKKADYLCVRGPRTQKKVKSLGLSTPPISSDPALLIPLIYKKEIITKFEYGIIPHYDDLEMFKKINFPANFKLINICEDVESVIDNIKSCHKIISSALHGLIVSNSYNIPCTWIRFSENLYGDDVKFYDYFESIGTFNYKAKNIHPSELISQVKNKSLQFYNVDPEIISKIQISLLHTFPYKLSQEFNI